MSGIRRYVLLAACLASATVGVVALQAATSATADGASQALTTARLPLPMLAADDADGPPAPTATTTTPTTTAPAEGVSRHPLVANVAYTSTTILVRGLPPSDVRSLPFPADTPTRIRIDEEDMLVVDPMRIVGTDHCGGDFQCWRYTIMQRAAFGTLIAEHLAGAPVRLYIHTSR